jgi:hypothetical protein
VKDLSRRRRCGSGAGRCRRGDGSGSVLRGEGGPMTRAESRRRSPRQQTPCSRAANWWCGWGGPQLAQARRQTTPSRLPVPVHCVRRGQAREKGCERTDAELGKPTDAERCPNLGANWWVDLNLDRNTPARVARSASMTSTGRQRSARNAGRRSRRSRRARYARRARILAVRA